MCTFDTVIRLIPYVHALIGTIPRAIGQNFPAKVASLRETSSDAGVHRKGVWRGKIVTIC